jgi:hypothetical protein
LEETGAPVPQAAEDAAGQLRQPDHQTDVKGSTMSMENIMRMWNDCVTGGRQRPKFKVTAKTASYTVTPDDFGSVLTTRGAGGAITFTLPAASAVNKGEWVLFINVADQNMIVAGADEGLVTFNDLTADSIAFQQASEKIGGAFLAISDGTSWAVVPLATELQTIAVTSA